MITNSLDFFGVNEEIAEKVQCADIYIAGVCPRDLGAGGWGALVFYDDTCKELYGGEHKSTHSKMELASAIKVLREFKYSCPNIRLHHYSRYLDGGIKKYIGNPPALARIRGKSPWKELQDLFDQHQIKHIWERRYSDNDYNERANNLAYKGYIEEFLHNNSADESNIYIYVDAKSLKGRGQRRWEGLLMHKGKCQRLHDMNPSITHPRMYLIAAIEMLETLENPCDVLFYTDFKYLCESTSERIKFWSENSWYKYDEIEECKVPVPNKDLWMKIQKLSKKHRIKWREETRPNIKERMAWCEAINPSS